jgi:RimJ/RimL family protein N-acetyltransferase
MQHFCGGLYRGGVDVRPPDSPLSDGVVTLRPWRLDDVPDIAAACADAEIVRWIHQLPQPYTHEHAREYVFAMEAAWRDGTGGAFAVVDSETGGLLGAVGLRLIHDQLSIVEVGYWTAASGRGRGLTTRALRLMTKWLLTDLQAERVQLRADVENVASLRVAEKAGFTREGVLRSSGFTERAGRRIDYAMYSALPGELE